MGFREFSRQEIEQVLATERVVRLGFAAGGEVYVVPVFFTWFQEALCGLTTPGRKTRMAELNASAAFQIDSSATTGPWQWSSVTGEGQFETLHDPAEFGPFAGQLRRQLADAPAWAQQELEQRFARLGMVPWRLRPQRLSGRAHEPGA
ncbi:MAG: pyridoxamine 5'-phosphate oxidase family protein [Dehalococcoidia bacterium]|nr:pyridoxamine 5'-phosphate oxidase family protein [Dehalococcoidia bacterium]